MFHSVLQPHLRCFVLVFIDDILVYSSTWETHLTYLKAVLDLLRENKLAVKSSKCSFAKTTLEYLGHIILDKGVSTDPKKTAAMSAWPSPTSLTELRGFLGLTGYYRKFVKHYGLIAKPLTNLLKKKVFEWSKEAEAAFQNFKQAMTHTPFLALPDFNKQFEVETDACDTGIAAVLLQQGHPNFSAKLWV